MATFSGITFIPVFHFAPEDRFYVITCQNFIFFFQGVGGDVGKFS